VIPARWPIYLIRRLAVLAALGSLLTALAAAAPGQDDPGKREYVRAGCDSCHGPDARGAGQAPELAGLRRPYPEFEQIVREGVGEMPPHSKDDVSDEQLAAIYKWLKDSVAR
jgi:mono/diheme cytochrome c family protein